MTSTIIFAHKLTSDSRRGSAYVLIGLLITLATCPQEASGMGKWLERRVTGDSGGEFWEDVKKARPLIKQRADQYLLERGHDITSWTSEVYVKGGGSGDEVWTAVYWKVAPENPLAQHGDLEVYLNNQGKIRRVVKYEQGEVQLLYGKDERIPNGMTPAQVRERLGEPDYKGRPIRELRDVCDETWRYKTTADRTVRIEVCFKSGKVFSVATFGE